MSFNDNNRYRGWSNLFAYLDDKRLRKLIAVAPLLYGNLQPGLVSLGDIIPNSLRSRKQGAKYFDIPSNLPTDHDLGNVKFEDDRIQCLLTLTRSYQETLQSHITSLQGNRSLGIFKTDKTKID